MFELGRFKLSRTDGIGAKNTFLINNDICIDGIKKKSEGQYNILYTAVSLLLLF